MKQETKTNGMCIAGFVCAFFVPLLGLIFSIIGFNQIKKSGEKGKGLAIAGIIIGSIFTIIAIFIIVSAYVGILNPIGTTTNNIASITNDKTITLEEHCMWVDLLDKQENLIIADNHLLNVLDYSNKEMFKIQIIIDEVNKCNTAGFKIEDTALPEYYS